MQKRMEQQGAAVALVDAHGHYHRVLETGQAARGQDGGIPEGVCCGTSPDDWPAVLACCNAYPGLRPAFGLHPWFVAHSDLEAAMRTLRTYLHDRADASVGEIGLDHSQDNGTREQQHEAFRRQLALGCEEERPISVHCVRAWGDLLGMLDAHQGSLGRVLVHDFRSSPEMASELTRRGLLLSFRYHQGPVGQRAPDAARAVPIQQLLVESDAGGRPDAPFQPARDLARTLRQLAQWRGDDPHQLARQLAANTRRFLSLVDPVSDKARDKDCNYQRF